MTVLKHLLETAGAEHGGLGCLDISGIEAQCGLAVEWVVLGKRIDDEPANLLVALLGYERTFCLCLGAGETLGETLNRHRQINRQPSAVHQRHIVEVARCATATRHYHVAELCHLLEHTALHLPEVLLAHFGKNLAHLFVVALLDVGVEVDELHTQFLCQGATKSRLAAAHISH